MGTPYVLVLSDLHNSSFKDLGATRHSNWTRRTRTQLMDPICLIAILQILSSASGLTQLRQWHCIARDVSGFVLLQICLLCFCGLGLLPGIKGFPYKHPILWGSWSYQLEMLILLMLQQIATTNAPIATMERKWNIMSQLYRTALRCQKKPQLELPEEQEPYWTTIQISAGLQRFLDSDGTLQILRCFKTWDVWVC